MSLIPAPLAGDPDVVENWGARFVNAANNLKKASDELRQLTDGHTYVSLAIEEVREKALDARTATTKVATRYEGTGAALTIYSHDLRAAQARANRAIAAFYNNDSTTAEHTKDDLKHQVDADNGQTPGLVDKLIAAQHALSNLVAQKASAWAEFNAAEADRDAAAMRAVHAIQVADDASKLNDSFFEAIEGQFQAAYEWAQKNLAPIIQAIHDIVKQISDIVSIIALVLDVLSIFLPFLAPLAGIVDMVALGLAAVVLLTALALLFLGKGSVGEVIGDTISVATSAFGGKLVDGLTEKLGSKFALDGVNALKGSDNAFATTAGQQFNLLKTTGPSGLQLLHAGVHTSVDLASRGTEKGVEGFFESPGMDLAPSAAGPSWNAPPTPHIPPVFASTSDVSSAMESHVVTNAASISVSVSS
ncbi:MAG: hypothetical protein JWO10_2141 [Microbacteriaceae bacterium]|nr:hypothetical protein [Microbacteriaceae bacterium]